MLGSLTGLNTPKRSSTWPTIPNGRYLSNVSSHTHDITFIADKLVSDNVIYVMFRDVDSVCSLYFYNMIIIIIIVIVTNAGLLSMPSVFLRSHFIVNIRAC